MSYYETLKGLRIGHNPKEDPEKRDWKAIGLRRRMGVRYRRMVINIRLIIGR